MSSTQKWIEDHKDYPHDYCLIWPFAREARVGRGVIGLPNAANSQWAHRVMCYAAHGPAPEGKPQAAHSCGNGDMGCVNPRHLSWQNNSQNQRTRYAQGRDNPNPAGNKGRFTPQQIADIRAKYGEFTQTKLAEMYGCSLGTIQYYLKYREQRGHAGLKIDHWSPDDDDALRSAVARGLTHKEAAAEIGRSQGGVTRRMHYLGLRSESPRAHEQRRRKALREAAKERAA